MISLDGLNLQGSHPRLLDVTALDFDRVVDLLKPVEGWEGVERKVLHPLGARRADE